MNQLTQQQRLLDRRKRPALATRQHAEQGLGQAARPPLDPRGVAAEPAQRRDTPIAIDQDQRSQRPLAFAAGSATAMHGTSWPPHSIERAIRSTARGCRCRQG